MAGAGYKLFNTGDVLTAQQVNEYLQQQTVMVFADASARTTALSGVLAEGMLSYLKDTNKVYVYDGSAWLDVSSEIPNQSGNSGKYLTTDGTNPSWGTISAGGMTLISRQTPSASTGFSFSSISGTYTDLYIRWAGLYVSNTSTEFRMRLNSASSGYVTGNFKQDEGSGSTVNAFPSDSNTQMGQSWSLLYNNSTASFARGSSGFARVYNYANTSYVKDYEYYNRLSDGGFKGEMVFGIYNSTSAITSVDIVRTTGTGTVSTVTNGFIELWGVK